MTARISETGRRRAKRSSASRVGALGTRRARQLSEKDFFDSANLRNFASSRQMAPAGNRCQQRRPDQLFSRDVALGTCGPQGAAGAGPCSEILSLKSRKCQMPNRAKNAKPVLPDFPDGPLIRLFRLLGGAFRPPVSETGRFLRGSLGRPRGAPEFRHPDNNATRGPLFPKWRAAPRPDLRSGRL